MRVPAAVATTVASLGLLSIAWHLGAAPAALPTPTASVSVVQARSTTQPDPSDPATTDAPRGGKTPSATPPPPSPPPSPTTIDGAVVATRYGDVQVRVTIQDGKLTDVAALQLTDVDGTSRRISAGAAPILRQEALDLQSAQIDSVSSATYTSEAYAQSLQSALDAAHAA